MNAKFLNLMGLCMRAGCLVSAAAASFTAIPLPPAHLAILYGGASANARKALSDACAYRSVPMLVTG